MDRTVYTAENSHAQIRAQVFSSDLNGLVVSWYHEGNLINNTRYNDIRYYITITEGLSVYILNIARVQRANLGMYEAKVTSGNNISYSDFVQLEYAGTMVKIEHVHAN